MFNKKLKLPSFGHLGLIVACGALSVGCASKQTQPQTAEVVPMASHASVTDKVNQKTMQDKKLNVKGEMTKVSNTDVIVAEATPASEKFPLTDIAENKLPEQSTFHFGFDKIDLTEEDMSVIAAHSKYLLDNPELILTISGHTDHHGPRVYNEYLSKQRADAIAKVFIDAGVSKSQIIISAKADDQPLENVESTKMNRRVELEYNELNMVSIH